MKIPQQLPQFTQENALLIVSGRLGIKFYSAKDGQIKKLKSFSFPRPSKIYTDTLGYFETRSSRPGKEFVSSGAVKEAPKKQRLRQELYRKLKKHLSEIIKTEKISKIYLFVPDYLHKEMEMVIKDNLSNKLKKQIKAVFWGNYLKNSALALVKKIKTKEQTKQNKKLPEPMTKEAKKLYEKAIKSAKVVKGKPAKNNPYRKIKK